MPEYGNDPKVSVFRVRSDNPKAPTMNVLITMPDGTTYEAGVWPKTSASGTEYLFGFAKPKEDRAPRRPQRRSEFSDMEDDVPWNGDERPAREKPARKQVDW